MKLCILAVGRMKAGPERELYDRYADRISKSGRLLKLQGLDLIEISESRHQNPETRKSLEAQELLSSANAGTRIVVLDENGKDIDSHDFANLIQQEQLNSTRSLAFAIGGADGHGDTIKKASIRKIRFGSMTWPHQLVRILLVEQIYRAITILSGHPYHRS